MGSDEEVGVVKCPNCDADMREDEVSRGYWYCDECGQEEDRT